MIFFYFSCSHFLMLIFIVLFCYFFIKRKLQIPFGNNKTSFAFVILGPGGHSYEMFHILKQIDWHRFIPIYVISNSDEHVFSHLYSFESHYNRNYFIERLIKPRQHYMNLYSPIVFYKSFYVFFKALKFYTITTQIISFLMVQIYVYLLFLLLLF